MREAAERARPIHQEIRDVLLKEWDPIGVQAIPEAQDEYDGYVPMLYSMLIARRPVNEVFEYLLWIESEQMGLTADRLRTQSIAEKLMSLSG